MEIKEFVFQEHGDHRGHLAVIEEMQDIPFKIKRVYYLYDTQKGFVRGCHAHKQLEQILVCVAGSCMIKLDDGRDMETILLNNPTKGIYIGANIWREMYDFSDDAVLLVIASELYDESDYIRDYEIFLEKVKSQKIM